MKSKRDTKYTKYINYFLLLLLIAFLTYHGYEALTQFFLYSRTESVFILLVIEIPIILLSKSGLEKYSRFKLFLLLCSSFISLFGFVSKYNIETQVVNELKKDSIIQLHTAEINNYNLDLEDWESKATELKTTIDHYQNMGSNPAGVYKNTVGMIGKIYTGFDKARWLKSDLEKLNNKIRVHKKQINDWKSEDIEKMNAKAKNKIEIESKQADLWLFKVKYGFLSVLFVFIAFLNSKLSNVNFNSESNTEKDRSDRISRTYSRAFKNSKKLKVKEESSKRLWAFPKSVVSNYISHIFKKNSQNDSNSLHLRNRASP